MNALIYTMAVAWLPLRDVPLAWLCNEPRCGRNQRGIRLCGEEKNDGGGESPSIIQERELNGL